MKTYLIALSLLVSHYIFAQAVTWTGNAGDNKWDTPSNWSNGSVPTSADEVLFDNSTPITVIGTAINPVRNIRIGSNSSVTLDLDISVGNTSDPAHCIVANAGAFLTINKTITITVPDGRNGLAIFAGADNANITIAATGVVNITGTGTNATSKGVRNNNPNGGIINNLGTLNITDCQDGIVLNGGIFKTNGTVNISNSNSDGFDLIYGSGTFGPDAVVTITNANSNGMFLKNDVAFLNLGNLTIQNGPNGVVDGIRLDDNSSYTNAEMGSITIGIMNDDGVNVNDNTTFINNGTLDISTDENPGSGNACIQVEATGTFENTSTGSITLIGGSGGSGRALDVVSTASFIQSGSIISNGKLEVPDFTNSGTLSGSPSIIGKLTNNGTLSLGN